MVFVVYNEINCEKPRTSKNVYKSSYDVAGLNVFQIKVLVRKGNYLKAVLYLEMGWNENTCNNLILFV